MSSVLWPSRGVDLEQCLKVLICFRQSYNVAQASLTAPVFFPQDGECQLNGVCHKAQNGKDNRVKDHSVVHLLILCLLSFYAVLRTVYGLVSYYWWRKCQPRKDLRSLLEHLCTGCMDTVRTLAAPETVDLWIQYGHVDIFSWSDFGLHSFSYSVTSFQSGESLLLLCRHLDQQIFHFQIRVLYRT